MTKAQRNGRRAALVQPPRGRGGGLLLGIVIGLVMGLIVAAGVAWYLTGEPAPFKAPAQVPAVTPPVATSPSGEVPGPPATLASLPPPLASTSRPDGGAVTAKPAPAASSTHKAKTQAPPTPARPGREPAPRAKADFTFFDILPGEQTGKTNTQKLPREVWWLQVAALKEAKDADRLKARLAMLGLPVQTQKVTSGGSTLHRVRVGPFKTEDEALAALDTLSENDFEPRLFKERMNPDAPLDRQAQ